MSKQINDHSFVKYAQDINEICIPLFNNTPVNFFEPCRIYKNNDYSGFMSDANWAQHFLNCGYQNSGLGTYNSEVLKSDFIFWSISSMWEINECAKKMGEDCVKFNFGNGITFIEREEKYTQLYYFAAGSGPSSINQFFLEKIDVLHEFILHFKERISQNKELNKAYNLRYQALIPDITSHFEHKNPPSYNTKKFYIGLPLEDNYYLTKRELDCLLPFLLGVSKSKIALRLNCSTRTVEKHIEHIKEKSVCKELSVLRTLFFNNKLIINYLLYTAKLYSSFYP